MAYKLRLKTITPDSLVFDGEVEEVVAPGELGEFGVLPGHVPFLPALFLGRLRFRAEGSGETIFIVHGGLADIKDDTVSVLTDLVESPEDVDISAARADIKAVSREIDGLQDEEGPAERAQLPAREKTQGSAGESGRVNFSHFFRLLLHCFCQNRFAHYRAGLE